jgi:hypothetical protein
MNWITTPCESSGCVEVASTPTSVLVRSTSEPHYILNISPEEWRSFLAAAKSGHFNDIAP